MAGALTMLFLVAAPKLCLGHGLVGYIQKDGSTEICTLRSTMGNADGNYGPLTVSASAGDACGNPPGTPKKVLAYSGDGTELRETQAGSGPYWLNPEETDATCRFKPGDKINAFVYISGNHGGTAVWEHRALSDGEGKISNADFQPIPDAIWDYSSSGPPETSKALGPHVETFIIPSTLQEGWQTLRWNWIAPGPVQFVHCVDVQIDAANVNPTTASPATTQQPSSTAATTTSVVSGEFSEVDGGNDRACRGASSTDNAASHYTVIGGTSSLEACKDYCRSAAGCVGIEYSSGRSRCEVWTRSAGIGASVRVRGYQCLRYTTTLGTTTAPAVDCVPLGDCGAWCMQSDYEAFCSAQGAAGSCQAPWCMTATPPSLVATKSRKRSFLGTALLRAGTDIIPAM